MPKGKKISLLTMVNLLVISPVLIAVARVQDAWEPGSLVVVAFALIPIKVLGKVVLVWRKDLEDGPKLLNQVYII